MYGTVRLNVNMLLSVALSCENCVKAHTLERLSIRTCTGMCTRTLHVQSLGFFANLFRQRVRVLVTTTLRVCVRKKVSSP